MNLYEVSPIEVTPLGYASHLVAAASKKQAADYVYEIDIDSIRKPTVIF